MFIAVIKINRGSDASVNFGEPQKIPGANFPFYISDLHNYLMHLSSFGQESTEAARELTLEVSIYVFIID